MNSISAPVSVLFKRQTYLNFIGPKRRYNNSAFKCFIIHSSNGTRINIEKWMANGKSVQAHRKPLVYTQCLDSSYLSGYWSYFLLWWHVMLCSSYVSYNLWICSAHKPASPFMYARSSPKRLVDCYSSKTSRKLSFFAA